MPHATHPPRYERLRVRGKGISPKDLKVHKFTSSKELQVHKVLERARKRKRESTSAHLQTCIILQPEASTIGEWLTHSQAAGTGR